MNISSTRYVGIKKHGSENFGDNKKFVLIIILMIVFLLGISIESRNAIATDEVIQTYVVKKGDTLSQIAGNYLGSSRIYKELVELNDLEIVTIDGVDYVWLKIGQVIKLPLTEYDALRKSWELILKRIKIVRRTDLKAAPKYLPGLRITKTTEGRTQVSVENIHFTLANLQHIKKVLEWYSLWDFAIATRSAAYERAETPGQIIEYTKVLLALAEQESSFRNIPGRHGEYSWWQMKPSTATLLDDSVDLPTARWLLQNDPFWTASRVLDHLLWGRKKNGSWEGAFTFYNGGLNNKYLEEPYAKQVMKRLKEF